MKRLIPLLAMLFICGSVSAADDILDSLIDYEVQVKMYLDVDTTNTTYITTGVLDHFIREAIITTMPMIRGDKSSWTFITTYRQSTYSLDSTFLGVTSVEWSKNDSIKSLIYVPKGVWYQQEHRSVLGQEDQYMKRPSFFDHTDAQIHLYPVPIITGDTIRIYGWQKMGNIADTAVFSGIVQAYRIPVLRCAAWLVAMSKQHPNADRFKANWLESMQMVNGALNRGGDVVENTGK